MSQLNSSADNIAAHNGHDRIYGIILAAASIILAAFMAMHPTVHSHHPQSFIEEMTGIAHVNNIVHGSLMANMGLLVLGLIGVCDRLGWHRLLVRGGFVAYVMGAIGGMFAAIVNGFVVGALVSGAAGDADADTVMERLRPALDALHLTGEMCSRLFVVAACAAALLWSWAMFMRGGAMRTIGVIGIVAGALPLILLVAGHLHMDVHGFGLFVLMQAIWYIAVASLLIRARVR